MKVVRHFHGQKYVTAETLTTQSNSVFASFLVTHRIFFMSPTAIPVNRCLTEWISSVKPRLLPDKLSF